MSGDALERAALFGLEFVDAASVDEVIEVLLEASTRPCPDHDRPPVVITPNVDHLVRRSRGLDASAVELAERARYVLPDGAPIVWASHLLGQPLQARLAGSDLVASFWPRIVLDRRRAFVVASSKEIARAVQADAPTVTSVEAPILGAPGTPPFDEFVDLCVDVAAAHGSEFVFVTIGHPKQNDVIREILARWPADRPIPTFLAVGASFEMYLGLVKRAPNFVQRIGMEWFFRFVQEPRRLFRRYFIDDVAFFALVFREWRSQRYRSAR